MLSYCKEIILNYEFEKTCNRLGIKTPSEQDKVSLNFWLYGEVFNKVPLEEFYSVVLGKKWHESIEELQINLDNFMNYYSYRKKHYGTN